MFSKEDKRFFVVALVFALVAAVAIPVAYTAVTRSTEAARWDAQVPSGLSTTLSPDNETEFDIVPGLPATVTEVSTGDSSLSPGTTGVNASPGANDIIEQQSWDIIPTVLPPGIGGPALVPDEDAENDASSGVNSVATQNPPDVIPTALPPSIGGPTDIEVPPGGSSTPTSCDPLDLPCLLREAISRAMDSFDKMITEALADMFHGLLVASFPTLNGAFNSIWLLASDISQFSDIVFTSWRFMLTIAVILLPLTLLLTVGAAMKEGVTSITGYANAREAMMEWVLHAGAAGASYFLLSKGIGLSYSLAQAIMDVFQLDLSSQPLFIEDLVNGLALKGGFLVVLPPIATIFIGIFALLMVVTTVLSVVLALAAQIVLLTLGTVVAPIMYIMGSVRPFRWITAMWSKAILVILLLLPLNTLLISLGIRMEMYALKFSTGIGGTILGILVLVGLASVLISINMALGQMVYGAAIEVAQKAMKATKDVVAMTAALVGGAVALPALGSLGASLGAAEGGALAGAGTNTASASAAAGGSGEVAAAGANLQGAASAFRGSQQAGMLANQLGSLLRSTNNPLLSGLGTGLQGAGALNSMRAGDVVGQASQRLGSAQAGAAAENTARGEAMASLDQPADFSTAIPGREQALKDIGVTINGPAASQVTDKKSQQEIGAEKLSQRAGNGVLTASGAMQQAQAMGIPAPRFLHDLGYLSPGGNFDSASASFLRYHGGQTALENASNFQRPLASVPAGPDLSPGDFDVALDVLHRSGHSEVVPASVIGDMAQVVHQQRIQLGWGRQQILGNAERAGTLDHWLSSSVSGLPQAPTALAQSISGYQGTAFHASVAENVPAPAPVRVDRQDNG